MSNLCRSISNGCVFDDAYAKSNYKIEYATGISTGYCAIYFSGSGIFFPNTEEALEKAIIREDRYEWYNHRITNAEKHIFVRDVAKQFYVNGINKKCNNLILLIEFLKQETKEYKIIAVGSSAGGYAATLIGSILNAERIFCFSGFFSLNHISYDVWYLVGEKRNDVIAKRFYDVQPYIKETHAEVFYIYPGLSKDVVNNDYLQHSYIDREKNVYTFSMNTVNHGVCLPDDILNEFINLDNRELKCLHRKVKRKKYISVSCIIFHMHGFSGLLWYTLKLVWRKLECTVAKSYQ